MALFLFTVFPTGLLLLCGLTHFLCHFEFNLLCSTKSSKCCIKPITQTLAFYPFLWTLYIIYLLIFSLIIITTDLLNHMNIFTQYTQPIIKYIPYCIIISSTWETLFSFHRYYKLKYYMDYRRTISTIKILKTFSIFATLYVSVYICQLTFIYWLYPLIILIFTLFNMYCQYKFIQLLLIQYSQLRAFDNISATNIESSMISAVYAMGCCSFLSIILSSFCIYCSLSIHSIVPSLSNPHRFYPLLWSISAALYMFNFVRNRQFIQNRFIKKIPCKKCAHNTTIERSQIEPPQSPTAHSPIFTEAETKQESHQIQQIEASLQEAITCQIQNFNSATASECNSSKALELLGIFTGYRSNTMSMPMPTPTPMVHDVNTVPDISPTTEDSKRSETDTVSTNLFSRKLAQLRLKSTYTTDVFNKNKTKKKVNLKPTSSAPHPMRKQRNVDSISLSSKGVSMVGIQVFDPDIESEAKDGISELSKNGQMSRIMDIMHEKNIDFSETMESLNILETYGFYSAHDINSLDQLWSYSNNIKRRNLEVNGQAHTLPLPSKVSDGDAMDGKNTTRDFGKTKSDRRYNKSLLSTVFSY